VVLDQPQAIVVDARVYAGLLGYRLRPELNAIYETMASLLSATMSGLVITALFQPGIATRRIQAHSFGAAETAEWSLQAMGIASIAAAFLESGPTIEWNDERLSMIRQALETEGGPGA
jgi:hypothetical protein